MLLLHALGRGRHDRAWLIAHDTDPLPGDASERFHTMCARRLDGEPIAYLVGYKAFHGLELAVDARVLDPRDDTETLAEWALELLAGRPQPAILDLGTGSGAIALALAHAIPGARVTATDASGDALTVARANANRLSLATRVCFAQGAWFSAVSRDERFDVIVSNPPDIASDDPHLPALHAEPRSALVSGDAGLADLRAIVRGAPAHLLPGGWLLLEHGWQQAQAVRTLLSEAGFGNVASRRDLAGIERASGGRSEVQKT
jgi:release factor glutamine methyltransferase